MALHRGTEIPTIDVSLVTIITMNADGTTPDKEIAIDTASKIAIEPQIETQEAIKLMVKGQLKAQKRETNTITGTTITLTDNLLIPELVQILQGGEIITDATTKKITKYTPPLTGSTEMGKLFQLTAYSAQYDKAGLIVQYEKITYPNCTGVPVALNSEDNVFRVPEYKIISAPKEGEAPYVIEYIEALPIITTQTPTPEP